MKRLDEISSIKKEIEEIYNLALLRHSPERVVFEFLKGLASELSGVKTVEVVATGKCAAGMARGASKFFGEKITRGLIITNSSKDSNPTNFETIVASHPYPDQSSLVAGERLINFCKTTRPDSMLLYLLSGGTSSMVAAPVSGISLEEKASLSRIMMNNGIEIEDLNEVRSAVSMIKGGGLLNYVNTPVVWNLIITDVLSEDAAVTGSGMMVKRGRNLNKIREILFKFSGEDDRAFIEGIFERIKNQDYTSAAYLVNPEIKIIDSNSKFLNTISGLATIRGFEVVISERPVTGEISNAVPSFFEKCAKVSNERNPGDKPFLFICGSEPGVKVIRGGTGGRSCEFAMRFSKLMAGRQSVLLAAGTDGKDGNSSFAGAIVDGNTFSESLKPGLEYDDFLRGSNSAEWIEKTGCGLITGETGVNLTDILIYTEVK